MCQCVTRHSVESALFAYVRGYYHIKTCTFNPLFFENFKDFTLFGTRNKKQVWQKVKLHLGLLSKTIDYREVRQVRISGSTIKIFGDSILGEYEFGRCFVFETLNVSHENGISSPGTETFKVIDDFTVKRIGKDLNSPDPVYTNDCLVSEIYFYNSLRVDGAKHVTDIVTVSELKKEQLYEFEFSDTMVSFKLRDALSKMGVKGIKERGKYKNGKNIYKKPVLEHIKRYVIPLDCNKYIDSNHVKFLQLSAKEIFFDRGTIRK